MSRIYTHDSMDARSENPATQYVESVPNVTDGMSGKWLEHRNVN